eukprot:3951567-Ditylum_brightwellii.AAC.1
MVQPMPTNPDVLAVQHLNLIANYDSITEVQVPNLVEFYQKYGQEYDLENLDWSQTFLKSLCLQALTHKVEEHMDKRMNQNKCRGL